MPLLSQNVVKPDYCESEINEWHMYLDSPRNPKYKIPMLITGGIPYRCSFSINDFDRKYTFRATFSLKNGKASHYTGGYYLADNNGANYYIASRELIESLKIATVSDGLITATWAFGKHDSKVTLKAVAP